ncbi:hypothetical protein Godav_024858 [Gossypium davidsonii]|uniref:Uncharacterized protein n=1 Tax=Gossypium davidsonii TaxID=34287 RepID=A0A7J8T9G1_GOSDV|nr:hypothetical protein [Gossypium davidsonii]
MWWVDSFYYFLTGWKTLFVWSSFC